MKPVAKPAKTQTGAYAVAAPEGYRHLSVTPASPRLGAEIGNIDLTKPISEELAAELKLAFSEYQVLFFRDQKISFDDHANLASIWGKPGTHYGAKTISKVTEDPRVRKFHADETSKKVSGDVWHSDQTCAPVPPLGSILYLHTVPTYGGGDTLFASMYAAYEGLSDRMQRYLDGLSAVHDGVDIFGPGTPNAVHPVIARHPESGRKLIFVNPAFTKIGPSLEIQPLSIFNVRVGAEYVGFYNAFGYLQSFTTATARYTDAVLDQRRIQGEAYGTSALRVVIEPTVQAKYGPIALRNKLSLEYWMVDARAGDAQVHEE